MFSKQVLILSYLVSTENLPERRYPIYNWENKFVKRDKLPEDPANHGRGDLGLSPPVTLVCHASGTEAANAGVCRGQAGDASR